MSGTHRGLAGHVRRVTVEDWGFSQIGKKNRPASIFLLRSGGGGDTLLAMSDEKIDKGGPAFPIVRMPLDPDTILNHPGMSLRDWLAGHERIDQSEDFGWELLEALAGPRPTGDWMSNPLGWFEWGNKWQAKVRYARADAMLAARNAK